MMATKINILIIMENLNIGGQQNYVIRQCERMAREKFNFFIAYLKDGLLSERAERAGAKLFPLPEYTLFRSFGDVLKCLKSIFILTRIINREYINLVVTNGGDSYSSGTISAKLAGVPVINLVGHSWVEVGSFYRWMPMKHLTDKFIVGNDLLESELVSFGGLRNKIKTVWHGVDLNKFHPDNSGQRIRNEFNIRDDTPVIGQISRLAPDKGFDVLLRGAAEVIKEIPQTKVMIVGDGPERTKLELLATDLGISGNVIFTGYRLDTPEFLAAFDVALFTYVGVLSKVPLNQKSGRGTYVLEVIASGKPIIITNGRDVADAVEDGVSGFIIPPYEPHILAEKIIYLLNNKEKARQMGLAGRKIAEEKFDLDSHIREIEDFYLKVALNRFKNKFNYKA